MDGRAFGNYCVPYPLPVFTNRTDTQRCIHKNQNEITDYPRYMTMGV